MTPREIADDLVAAHPAFSGARDSYRVDAIAEAIERALEEKSRLLETAERRLKDEASAYKVLAEGYEGMKLQVAAMKRVVDAAVRLDERYTNWQTMGLAGADMLEALIAYRMPHTEKRVGQVLIQDGSAPPDTALPSFANDTNTGRFRDASGEIRIVKEGILLCGSVPDGGGDPCAKHSGHGGVCENGTHVWDWKPKLRGE